MTQDTFDLPGRRSIRLKDYDYSLAGAYFVTICAQDREHLFGDIVDGGVDLNDGGKMVQSVWTQMPRHYYGIDVDAFVVMPNHIHGIIILTEMNQIASQPTATAPETGQRLTVAPTMSLPDVVHRFKSLTTAQYRHGVTQRGWRPFSGRLWQRNYYERIIRNEAELNGIREYVYNNPALWSQDENNLQS